MHACLNVDEILRLIANELIASEAWATAAAFACCRKSLEDPVLDALWKTQDRLIPLFRSLPGDVWDEDGPISFKRPPTMLEWARFQKYARRMRNLEEPDTLGAPEVLSVLQLRAANEPLLPNLKTLRLRCITGELIPFIPLFLSPRTTVIDIMFTGPSLPETLVASAVTAFPMLCPNLQEIDLYSLPRDPTIAAGVSGMLLATNRNTLRHFCVDSPLTEEGREVVFKLPNLRELSTVIERDTSSPSAVLPNLAHLTITCDHGYDWLRMFQGATLERLESVTFHSESEQIGDFLGAFESVALAASVQNTLSILYLFTWCSWNPSYTSLLPFTQMEELTIQFSCIGGCSSSVDDDIIITLARAMPKLQALHLGGGPCRRIPTGVTVKGLVFLARHCPDLAALCVHFQVVSLSAPPVSAGTISYAEPTAPRRDCALGRLHVGKIPMPKESVSAVALTLARIFPRIHYISCVDENWLEVMNAISLSRQIVNCSRVTLESGS